MNKLFSKKEAVKFGWEAMKGDFWFFVLFLSILFLINIIVNLAGMPLRQDPANLTAGLTLLGLILIGVRIIVQLYLDMAVIRLSLKIYNKEKGSFSVLRSSLNTLFKFIASTFIYGLAVIAGIILLIVPGIIIMIRWQFFGYFIVDRNCGPIEALKKSWAITKGSCINLILFGLLLLLINLAGVLCLLVGLFATVPATMVARAFVYKKLQPLISVAKA